ncbi:MAG: GspE/PulE family protein [Candidatus Portnoybacteria bacterium]|nr:GspE/PulE family protein [Candidatus Portnoybacteria bacterium]MDD4982696.1 GspE/PulE family protein [Candidatus Portnoybacteria bacterium]
MPKTPKKPALEEKLEQKLSEVRHQEEETRAELLADQLELTYVNLTAIPIDSDALFLIPEKDARAGQIVVMRQTDKELKIALADPQNPAAKKILEELGRNFTCQLFIASKHSLEQAFDRYKTTKQKGKNITGQVEISAESLQKLQEELKSLEDVKKKIETAPQDTATGVLEIAIAGAMQNDASDIHLESKDKGALFRYRIDGILHDVVFLSPKTYALIISRLKLLSGMVLNVRDKAQDGRFTIKLSDMEVEVRVSVIPGPNGENVVMRLLNPKSINLNIKDLGLRQDAYDFLIKEIQKPNGMIVTTGPTGSGKTTALYAFLKEVTNPELKIITLEDPIEYHLDGVTQTQVETEEGYTFAAGLRAILRQDPDVILVGEIRDKETAEIAIQAALTGHIVFSTLHTNDAAGAIPRFIDMGANPTSLSSALIDMLAQRLLRRICKFCHEDYEPTAEEKAKIKKVLGELPKTIEIPDFSGNFKLSRGKGCAKCNNTGYKGRVGVFEIIPVDTEIEKLITKSPSHAEIIELVKKKGFVSMYQDGVIKILQKMTTFEELDSIVGER